MKWYPITLALALLAGAGTAQAQRAKPAPTPAKTSGNPLFPGWYADPEAAIFGSQYWIYPTYSVKFEDQVFLDAFSSPDLVHWTKHPRILDTAAVKWAHRALWAPAIVAKGGKYYLFFGANDYHPEKPNEPPGGIGVAVADNPAGPFKDYLGKPLVGTIENGAQPIDQFVFKDVDGKYYLIYGGWQHCNIARLKNDFTGFLPLPDGSTFKSITPEKYVEGPLMFRHQGKYYFMWSEGGWTGPDYSVAYAVGDSPFGPFQRVGKILQQDPKVATGAGHHSVINVPGTDRWYIVYHRHPLGDTNGNHREVCIEEMHFDKAGRILPVKLTTQGVRAERLFDGHPHVQARSAGTEPGARVRVAAGHLGWADVIFVMEKKHADRLRAKFGPALQGKPIINLRIPDNYTFQDPALVALLRERLAAHYGPATAAPH